MILQAQINMVPLYSFCFVFFVLFQCVLVSFLPQRRVSSHCKDAKHLPSQVESSSRFNV